MIKSILVVSITKSFNEVFFYQIKQHVNGLVLPNTDIKHNWSNHGLVIPHKCCSFFTKFSQTNIISTLWHSYLGLIRNDEVNPSCGSVYIGEYSPITIQDYVIGYNHILSVQHPNMLLAVTGCSDFVPTKSLMIHQYRIHSVGYTPHWSRIDWRTMNVLYHQWDLDYMVANDIDD